MDLTVLESLRAAEATQAAEAARAATADRAAWHDLVRLAAGGGADAKTLGRELKRLGRSADELHLAADRHARRGRLEAELDQMAKLRRRVKEIDAEAAAASRRCEETIAPLRRERQALEAELFREAGVRAVLLDLDAAEKAVTP